MGLNEKIPLRDRNVKGLIDSIQEWNISLEDKKSLKRFFNDLKIGKVTGNQISDGTLSPYISNLKISLEFLKKPTKSLTPADTEKLSEWLLRDKLMRKVKRKEGKQTKTYKMPFVESGKIKIKNVLVLYLEWMLKGKAERLTRILKVRPKLKEATIDYLKESEVERLYKACKNAEERFLIAVLFDSGARAEEFHNIRKNDVELPKGDGYVKLTLKEEYSKTKGRTISLYWNKSFEAVNDYLKERTLKALQGDEPLFEKNYRASRKFLERLGKKVLGRSIHYHLFRHTSATYYADKMNRQQLCIRYGWRFRSPMPDRYISRIGVQDKELDEKFTGGEIKVLKEALEKEKQLRLITEEALKDNVTKLHSQIQDLKEMFNPKDLEGVKVVLRGRKKAN